MYVDRIHSETSCSSFVLDSFRIYSLKSLMKTFSKAFKINFRNWPFGETPPKTRASNQSIFLELSLRLYPNNLLL